MPVSVRAEDEQGQLGNKITMMVCPLPVYADEPARRFEIVSEAMGDLKESKQALGAEVIAGLQEFAPPTVFAQGVAAQLLEPRSTTCSSRTFPARSSRSTCSAASSRSSCRSPFLAPEQALAIAIMSYNGRVDIGLMGDYDAMPDLDDFAGYLEDELGALAEAAGVAPKGAARKNGRVPEPAN